MAVLPGVLLPHRVTVEPSLGAGSEGPAYGPPVRVRCNLQGALTVDAAGEHVGSVKVYARPDVARWFPLGSRLTLPGGQTAVVQAVAVHTDGGLGAWQHVEVSAA